MGVYLCMGFTTTFDLVNESASHFSFILTNTIEVVVYLTQYNMGLFSFSNEFEVAVNHPKEDVYEKFTAYIRKKGWAIISAEQAENVSFQTKTTLISWPIDFTVNFNSVDENSTKLSVSISAAHLDLGRSKGIINDIIKEIYG